MNPLHYLHEYVKTNQLTAYFLLFLSIYPVISLFKMPEKWRRWSFAGLLLFSLVLRVGWLQFSSHVVKEEWNAAQMIESDAANVHAIELATQGIWFHDSEGNPTGRRPIGYPTALALVYKIFGVHRTALYVFNLLLFLIGLYFLFRLARLLFSERVAFAAATVYGLYPNSVYSVILAADEHLFIPLWLAGLYLLLREVHGRPFRGALFWYGLLFGYAAMTRTHAIFMPFTVALAYRLLRYSWKKVLLAFFSVFFLMQLVNLPWTVRNYKVYGVLIPYTTNNFFIYRSFNSTATPEGGGHVPVKGESGYSEEVERALTSGNGGLHHLACGREIKRWMIEHPLQFLNLGFSRALVFMGWNRMGVWPIWFQYYDGSFDPSRPLDPKLRHFFEEASYAVYYGVLFSSLFGMILIACRWRKLPGATQNAVLVLASCFFFWILEHFIIYPDRKYRFPLEPLMMVMGCYFLDFWAFQLKPWRFLKRKAR